VDIGGTFTDLVCLDEDTGEVNFAKVSSTPSKFSDGVIDCLKASGLQMEQTNFFGHGSTVVINAITERKGARVAFITTKGFRDILEIQRGNRPDMYNFVYEKEKTFVPRQLCFEVEERLNSKGEIIKPLSKQDVLNVLDECKRKAVRSIAVCFIHSYVNPIHEKICGKIVSDAYPEARLTLSHELTKEWREYERANTAVLNAYVQPVASEYLSSLENELKKLRITSEMYVMQSNGGFTLFEQAKDAPIHLVESGPVAGVIGSSILGGELQEPNIITLDIGGTTAKTSLIENGNIRIVTEYRLERTPFKHGYPVKIGVVDIVEIGAGGGSIAWIDDGGAIHVGPRSAGADPGPACYGKGGTEATVTDANVITGRINPDYFLGGKIKLTVKNAQDAIRKIAEGLGVSLVDAALGIIKMANSNMVNALKLVSVRRGYDPRGFMMVAFGGGGGAHAATLAQELKAKKVLIPKMPAHFSSWGILMCDLRHDYIRTKLVRTQGSEVLINEIFEEMEQEAHQTFVRERVQAENIFFQRWVDARYVGQEHTVRIPAPSGRLTANDLQALDDMFGNLHEKEYTFRTHDAVEIVNFHLSAFGRVKKAKLQPISNSTKEEGEALKGQREVYYDDGIVRMTHIFERDLLPVGFELAGPAIVEEPASTVIINPGQKMNVDKYGNLVIE
jgi:N-methylhydantoinase A